MIFPKKEYIILFVVIFLYINSFLCVSSNSNNKIDPTLALLPWTLNNKSNIEIRVSRGCYNWKFEDEFLTVNGLVVRTDEFGNYCTDVVNVNPKWPHMNLRGIFTIIASDIYTGENLRSEIHIAKVESIKISTSSKRIRLGSLENLYAIGFDNEHNTFTSLSGLKIVWELENDNIISEKNDGSQILVTGSKVGSVNVYVKIIEDDYIIISSSVTMYVEDPFKIIPYVRKAPFGSLYQIHLVKEGSANYINFFRKEFHFCKIDQNIEVEAQIVEDNKLIINNYNDQDAEAEFLISATCMDRRVDGSFFTSMIYLSFPKEIVFAVQDMSLVFSQNNFDEFVQLYFIEGEQLAERSGFFNRILQNNELTIVENKTVFLQLKLFNYKREFLHVPINSNFNVVCKKGCSSINIAPFQTEYNIKKSTSGFLEITGNSVGSSELFVVLDSIGEMNYSKLNGQSKLTKITASLKIDIVKDIGTIFSNLPLVLYPGEQKIDIKENITGGKGPFFFCSSNPSIAIIDFHTGLLKTNYITGSFNVIVYDIGVSHHYASEDQLSCKSFKNVYGLNIPVFVAYINGLSLELLSSNSKFYNNTIYTSISQNSLSLEVRAEPIRDSSYLLDYQSESSLYNFSFNKLDTLDIKKLYDPCEIVEVANLLDFQSNSKHTNGLSTQDCLLILDSLKIVSYYQLATNYDMNTILLNISEQKVNIELKKHGTLAFDNFIEFGVEFIYDSKIIKRKIIDIGLTIFIFQEISFVPIINEIVLSYFDSSNTPSNDFYIEKSSKIELTLHGGPYDYQYKTNFSIEFIKFKLFLLMDNEEREFVGTKKEIDDHPSIQISQLDEINKFLIECNGELAVGFVKFAMAIFDEYKSEVYRIESVLKIYCKSIDHINMFWVNQFPIIGKYTCNTRNDDCMVFHFNSNKRHRFISLAYDKNNNLLLSYNKFKIKWEIENINEYSIDFLDENELINQNIIDLSINLGTEYYMKDVNIKFEVFSPDNFDENNSYINSSRFSIITKGIFTRPPILISSQMLNIHTKFRDYHQTENENDGINFIGSWNLLEGQHQFGVIYGTNNFKIFFDDQKVVKYSLCNDIMRSEDIFLIKNDLFHRFHDRLNIFPFCLDSEHFSRNENGTKKINVYIEDQLILPKYLLKKELIFNNLNRLDLVWLDRVKLNDMNKESGLLPFTTYFTCNNVSDQNSGYINHLKIPRKYVSLPEISEYKNYFDSNKEIYNTLPCINGYCLIDDKSRSILIVIMYDDQGMALEPWQHSELRIEIEYKLKNTYESDLEFEEQIQNSLNNFSIGIKNLSFTVFQVMEIKQKNIDIELVAKILDLNSNVLMYSNSLNLKVYESIELESNTDIFSLFPYGSPLHIGFKGGPREFKSLKLEWDVQLEKKINKNVHKDILLIRNNTRLVIEPLGEIGKERVLIRCFLTNENKGTNTFKALLFSKLITVYVDIPDGISLFSPESEYLYLGYPKVYTLRTWKSNKDQTLEFHHSQYFPSKFSKCRISWSISQNLNNSNYILEDSGNNKCELNHDIICISRVTGKNHINSFKINNMLLEDYKYNNISMYDYIALLYPTNIGISYLNIRLSCSFGNKEKVELELTQKLNVIKAINSVENGIWIIKDSLYYLVLPREVAVKSNNKLDIEYSNNSQLIYLNTWNSSNSFVIFNEEKRFELESDNFITLSPIIISEPKIVVVELSKYNDYSAKLSIIFFNSMGVRLFPNPNYCNGINLYLIPVQNTTQEFLIKEYNLYVNKVLEESNLNVNCQFLLHQNPETRSMKLIEEINSWGLVDSRNELYRNYRHSCFMIQIYSKGNKLIGSQPFCLKLSVANNAKGDEYNIYMNESNLTNINSTDKIIKYQFEVFAGSMLHLSPIKWKALNSTPDQLSFCVVIKKLLKNPEHLLKKELSTILNIPLTLIGIIRGKRIQTELFDHLNISYSNKQLVCMSINKKIDPFEFWVILIKYSSIIYIHHGIIWIGMDENDKSSQNNNFEYNTEISTWELLSSYDSVKIIENELLAIPMSSSIKFIRLRLPNLIEINLKVIPLNGKFTQNNDFMIVNKKYNKLHINNQFSFSIYFNDNEFINKFFNNIYYNSPLSNINCEVYSSILKKIYTTTPFWSLTILNSPFLLPSCNMVPRNSELSIEIKNEIVSSYYTQNSMYILSEVNKTSFIIQMQFKSSKKLQKLVPVHFYPILLKSLSSPLFSNKSTFIQGWVNDAHHIEIIVPFNSKEYFEFPIQILFWFGYENTKLIAYKVRSQISDEYIVNFTKNDLQGEVKILNSSRVTKTFISDLSAILPFYILLEFNCNGEKHLIDIILKNRDINDAKEPQKITTSKYFAFSNSIIINQHLCLIFTSLAILSISIFHFLFNKKQVVTREINSSPFRKLNTQKW
ncbi:large membrane with signal peptide and transmembrane domain [Cryptosporidium sp. chipmunk genotype I]|uniref:large membrane with signal peptide and transmembrane domain n=1 Tax=Cryptosporidium sp. chipmunk genotype I TaxID=1280935 RepID=UPI00351A9EB8|nr:large membrane with signal peptide and transmembrane domain [Cryptosporidium sp. chipmunk genotype I]